jgi:hypothetical protein
MSASQVRCAGDAGATLHHKIAAASLPRWRLDAMTHQATEAILRLYADGTGMDMLGSGCGRSRWIT